jgi:hypothetical protein
MAKPNSIFFVINDYNTSMGEASCETNTGDMRIIARTVDKLPELNADCVRVIHFTRAQNTENILKTGLDYGHLSMAMATARAWGKADEVEYYSDDPRYNYPGVRIVVMDMSNEEWKGHNETQTAPGRISQDKIVGIVDPVRI